MSDSGHILIVDDSRMNRLTLLRAIEHLGHTGVLAEDGIQALDMVQAESFDAILLDILMPELDGFEVLKRIKADSAYRDIPVIVISGLDEVNSAVRCIELGAEDYLTKPFNSVLLKARLGASLEKKQHRDLERAYLEQEIMLRQSEKLATLGKLAAGMAHELNNPTASAQRSVDQLDAIIRNLRHACLKLAAIGITEGQRESLIHFERMTIKDTVLRTILGPLSISDREAEIEDTLSKFGVDQPWEYSPSLVEMDIDAQTLKTHLSGFAPSQMPAAISWLSGTAMLHILLNEMRQAHTQVTRVVEALKSYSFMDQAPVQLISVQDGLESSIIVHPGLSGGDITLNRDYSPDVPRVEAYGSELNQVWSNILDNAVTAMEGSGDIWLRTSHDTTGVRVEIEDNGVGIAEEHLSRIFDPFFTTKPPGQGTGLGLTISYNVVQKHGGKIEVHSQPGSTRIVVHLPVSLAQAAVEPAMESLAII